MADFALIFDPVSGLCDLAPNADGSDFLIDQGLDTALLLSIGVDAQAPNDAILPQDAVTAPGTSNLLARDRRGWWGDWYVPGTPERAPGTGQPPADRMGCLDWLYSRSNRTAETLANFKESWQLALKWLVDDGIASSVKVRAGFTADGYLVRQAVITRPSGAQSTHRYDELWANSPLAPTQAPPRRYFSWDTPGAGFDTPGVVWGP
jgi:phage gp46-like protein